MTMSHFLSIYLRLLKCLLAALLAVMVIPISLQIVSRYTGFIPKYIWTEEAARFCFVWMIMVGSVVAVKDEAHFEVDLFPMPNEPRGRAKSRLVVHALMAVMGFVFAGFGCEFARFGFAQRSEMSGINMATIYASFPFAGLSWCLLLFEKITTDLAFVFRDEEKGQI